MSPWLRLRRAAGPAALAAGLIGLAGCVAVHAPPAGTAVKPEPSATAAEESAGVRTPPATEQATIATPAPSPAAPARPVRLADGATLFHRLGAALETPDCPGRPQVQAWSRRYAASPARLEAQLRGALPLMAHVLEQSEAHDLPANVVLIPFVESGYRPDARGPGGPAGLWQLVAGTARHLGLEVSRQRDARFDPKASTDAALRHLADLRSAFGHWRLAVMAYNAGEGRLQRALARSPMALDVRGRPKPAGLPATTYAYLDKLDALACLLVKPERYGLSLPDDPFEPIDLASTSPPEPPASQHDERPEATLAAPSASRTHVVAPGDSLWRIARRHGISVAALAEANGLRIDAPLRIGMRLKLPD